MNELSILDSLFNNGMDDVFGGLNNRSSLAPKVDVTQSKDTYNLEMELPGRTQEDVNIELDNKILTISSRADESKKNEADKNKYLIRERRTSSFSRSFSLPDDIDDENVKAIFKNGILNIELPRKAVAGKKKITIECA